MVTAGTDEHLVCHRCGHDWHGLGCEHSERVAPTMPFTWEAASGHPCDCPTSYQETPC